MKTSNFSQSLNSCMCSCITKHKWSYSWYFSYILLMEFWIQLYTVCLFQIIFPSMKRSNWPGWYVAGWWWRTSSTLSLAASSEHVTTQRISLDDCVVSLISTWLPSAVFWIMTPPSHSTRAALLCNMRRLCGWISFAQAAWRPLIWMRCLGYDEVLTYCWDLKNVIVQTRGTMVSLSLMKENSFL